jgi:hypothetical protein
MPTFLKVGTMEKSVDWGFDLILMTIMFHQILEDLP